MTRLAPLLSAVLLVGCVAAAAPPPLPYPAIPAARVEVVPPPPSTAVTWQPGHWHWDGRGYEWLPGRYVERRVALGRWVPGHWDHVRGRDWVWVPGRWV